MRGSNPRLSAHKTDALTTELMGRFAYIAQSWLGDSTGSVIPTQEKQIESKLENLGIDPSASRMLSERSTI